MSTRYPDNVIAILRIKNLSWRSRAKKSMLSDILNLKNNLLRFHPKLAEPRPLTPAFSPSYQQMYVNGEGENGWMRQKTHSFWEMGYEFIFRPYARPTYVVKGLKDIDGWPLFCLEYSSP
jgi:hypothetical protein